MDISGDGQPAGEEQPIEAGPSLSERGERSLVSSASRWIGEAMTAWTNHDFAKVALLAPLAVEHLGKAVLWRTSPALLVQLNSSSEPSLLILATKPDLSNPVLRTVSLPVVLDRVERLLGGLPVPVDRRKQMVNIRNGATHVGTTTQSRVVLLDTLALCRALLDVLDMDPISFFQDHYWDATQLLDAKRTEIGDQVAAKRARARRQLNELEQSLGDDQLYKDTTERLEEQAADAILPDHFGTDLWAVDHLCPECGRNGRLMGRVLAEPEIDVHEEPTGGGFDHHLYISAWMITMYPQAFACNVCHLTVVGPEELAECGLPASNHFVEPDDLGEDFNPEAHAAGSGSGPSWDWAT